jgi:DNA repair protein RadC
MFFKNLARQVFYLAGPLGRNNLPDGRAFLLIFKLRRYVMQYVLKKITDFGLFICERIANYADSDTQNRLVQTAIKCLEKRLWAKGDKIDNTETAIDYFKCQLLAEEDEVFAAMFLDSKGHVLHFEKLFRGTINSCRVYPRVVVKKALFFNAAAVIVGHNHLSSHAEPSQADIASTKELKKALDLIDVKLFDHIIVAGTEHVSFKKSGYLD